jgi:hypothetical protein
VEPLSFWASKSFVHFSVAPNSDDDAVMEKRLQIASKSTCLASNHGKIIAIILSRQFMDINHFARKR